MSDEETPKKFGKDITLSKGQAIGSAGVLGLGGIVALFMQIDGYFYSRREGVQLKTEVSQLKEEYRGFREEIKREVGEVRNDIRVEFTKIVSTIRRTEDNILTRQTQITDRMIELIRNADKSMESRVRALENEVSTLKTK